MALPIEKKKEVVSPAIEENHAVENDDELLEPPSLFFAVFWYMYEDFVMSSNDVTIRVSNSRYVNGVDLAENPPSSYQDYKNVLFLVIRYE